MPGAAAEAATGSHQVLVIKKSVLVKVISQMTIRRTRPMEHEPPEFVSRTPHGETDGQIFQPARWRNLNGAESITGSLTRKRFLRLHSSIRRQNPWWVWILPAFGAVF